VQLGHGLTSSGPVVEAKVEGVGRGREGRGQMLLGPVDPYEEAGLLGVGQFLESGDGARRSGK
jgi:hypothetical protein